MKENRMDAARFKEQARQDRNRLIVGIVVITVISLTLIIVAAGIGSMALALGILVPLVLAAFACAGFLSLRLTNKMERDSYEEGMLLVMEGAPMNCTITDEKGTVLFCNDRAADMFNASKREYAEKLFGDFLPEIQPDGTRSMEVAGRHIQTAFRDGTNSFEWWQQTKPGGEQIPCTVDLTAASVHGMSRMFVFTKDLRETRALREQEAALKERMQAVLDSSPLVCILADESANLLDVNKEAENMFGIPDRQMLLKNFGSFMPERQPDGSNSLQKTAAMAQEAIRVGQSRSEFMYLKRDGTPLPTEVTVNRVTVGGKNLVIVYSRDMRSEYADREAEQLAQKKLQDMTDRLNGQLESQFAAITQSSSAIEQMSANTKLVSVTLSKNAQNVKDLQEASEVGHSGLNEVAADIKEIARESASLLEINSVMQNIASQTNLLSMNAAIEAAHAGESGRGFAVVADEIRKLAESSSRQSKTVGGVLKKIKGSIDKITKSTDNVMNKFHAIDGGVKAVAEQEHGIQSAMEQQSAGSVQIMQAIAQVNDLTRQVKEDARQMAEAAAKLGV